MKKTLIVFTIVVLVSSLLIYAELPKPRKTLIVYSADAYVGEVSAFIQNFSVSYGIDASLKSAGSFALAQQISQGNPCDVFFSIAKSAVQKKYLGDAFSGWAIAIATDQMVIAYSKETLNNNFAFSIINYYNESAQNSQYWENIFSNLTSGEIKVGISNPSTDPAGLRGWLVLKAAGYLYVGNESYFINRIIQNKGNITSDHAANLVAPLEGGNIQFLFIYKSFAISHGLHYLSLNDYLNFGNVSLASYYSQFNYELPTGLQTGSPIALYVTVPSTSQNKEVAYRFVVYAVKNSLVLRNFGMNPLAEPLIYNSTTLPNEIDQLVTIGIARIGGAL